MNRTGKALLLTALHLAIAAGIGGKYLVDRWTRPRFWLRTVPVDPNLPIRGRYVRLRVEVPVRDAVLPPPVSPERQAKEPWRSLDRHALQVALVATPEGLVARAISPVQDAWTRMVGNWEPDRWPERVTASLAEQARQQDPARWVVRLDEPLACFIPERIPDPSFRPAGEELWVEATLPGKGPLRPIRLGVLKDGKLTPLSP